MQFVRNTVNSISASASDDICSHGFCPALVIMAAREFNDQGELKHSNRYEYLFVEATAVPSHPRKGRLIMPGLLSTGATKSFNSMAMASIK